MQYQRKKRIALWLRPGAGRGIGTPGSSHVPIGTGACGGFRTGGSIHGAVRRHDGQQRRHPAI